MENNPRIICRFDGNNKGPLIICMGAMHGNEPAGVIAMQFVMKMLEVEPIKNQGFEYKGRFLGLIGNLKAYNQKKRFLDKDLNRQFSKENYERCKNIDRSTLKNEDKELFEIIELINEEIKTYNPTQLIILDLHTTSSFGGIFSICQNDDAPIKLASALHAPIVLGIVEGLKGTTLHYFTSENMGVETLAVTFESGQHNEQLSVNRAIAGIICLMREVGALNESDVENYHEDILKKYSENLPKLTKLVEHYPIEDNDEFQMLPGFNNFEFLEENKHIANNRTGAIKTQHSGYLLMPLYQKQGEDGYFIVQEILQ